MRRLSYIIYHLSFSVALLTVMLLSACSNDDAIKSDDPLPDGMGRIHLTVTTRAVNEYDPNDPNHPQAVHEFPWENPDHLWEVMHSLRVIICKASDNTVVQIKEVAVNNTSVPTPNPGYTGETNYFYSSPVEVTSDPLPVGNYHIFATANYADGYFVGSTVNLDRTEKFPFGLSQASDDYSSKTEEELSALLPTMPFGEFKYNTETRNNNIPMTGSLTDNNGIKSVGVTASSTPTEAGTLIVWRVIGKMQFEFTNESDHKIQILGVEVEPINLATDDEDDSKDGPGIYLFSKDDLTSTANLVPMFANGAEKKGVTATWPLNTSTLQTSASVSMGGVFSGTELTYGSKLEPLSLGTAGNGAYMTTLQEFRPKEKVNSRDNEAFISFKVTPRDNMTFTPKNLTFKACRGGTDEGYFDVEVIGDGSTTILATAVRPERYNVSPYLSTYSYPLSGITGEVEVRIYVYGLATDKYFAFGDVAISGDVTNNTGSAIQEFITLPDGARSDVGTVFYQPAAPLVLDANGTGTLFFYVNETDATYTTTNNQLSLRFKIKRQKGSGWYDDEIRYGVTTYHDLTDNDPFGGYKGGFNVIRRNDWIHIPVHLTDWQFRVEPLAFAPIAGYPAKTLSSDALTATFSTGGMIALQPFVKKYNDPTWLDFDNSQVRLVGISWQNSDGRNVSGNDKIVKTAFAYDYVTKCIIGELNNGITTGGEYKTTFTIDVELGPSSSPYNYTFTFNVILNK